MRNERCLLKHSPVNRLAFVVCAKRGGVGHEGQKRDRVKGLKLYPHLHNPPPPPPFSIPLNPLPLSTPATQAINRPSSSLVHMLARVEAN